MASTAGIRVGLGAALTPTEGSARLKAGPKAGPSGRFSVPSCASSSGSEGKGFGNAGGLGSVGSNFSHGSSVAAVQRLRETTVVQAVRSGEVAVRSVLAPPPDGQGRDTLLVVQEGGREVAYGRSITGANGASVAETEGVSGLNKTVPVGKITLQNITAPVTEDLEIMNENLKQAVGARHPVLMSASEQIFGAGGKRLRPALVLLVSRATAVLAGLENIREQHRRVAEITEMLHTASLVHDDVLDDSATRRGKQTVHRKFGTKVAVMVGDFLFAQSSWNLAQLENLEVIKLFSQVIADFANGEIKQSANLFDCDLTLEDYLEKSYFKTATLIAASAKSAAIFSGVSPSACNEMFEYGRHLGLAFQVVDDILDFTQTSEQLGKPAGSDLASGNLTAPVLFALEKESELRDIIESDFQEEGSLERAVELVKRGGGIQRARQLAQEEGELARRCLQCLPYSESRRSLEALVDYVLERLY